MNKVMAAKFMASEVLKQERGGLPAKRSRNPDDLLLHRMRLEFLANVAPYGIRDEEACDILRNLCRGSVFRQFCAEVGLPEALVRAVMAHCYHDFSGDIDKEFYLGTPNFPYSEAIAAIAAHQLAATEHVPCPLQDRLDELATILRFRDPSHIRVVSLLYLCKMDGDFQKATLSTEGVRRMGFSSDGSGRLYLLRQIARVTNLPSDTIAEIFQPQGIFSRFCLTRGKVMELNDIVAAFIEGLFKDSLGAQFVRPLPEPADTFTLDDFQPSVKSHLANLRDMIRAWVPGSGGMQFLLYGLPGTGKTAAIRILVHQIQLELGLVPYEVRAYPPDDEGKAKNAGYRFTALNAAQYLLDPEKTILVVDEADDLLCPNKGLFAEVFEDEHGGVDKTRLNGFLDQSPGVCIFITNRVSIDPSVRRRFNYSISFGGSTSLQRANALRHALRKHQIEGRFSDVDVQRLSRITPLEVGGLATAVRSAAHLIRAGHSAMQAIETTVAQHQQLMYGTRRNQATVCSQFSLDGLSVRSAETLPELLEMAQAFVERQTLGDAAADMPKNLNLLLHGPPGTGKTEFVRFLATRLGRELIVRTGADLLSKYVGETEQNIQSAFSAAEAAGGLLFFDEVDGLLQNRSDAGRNWEVTQVNQMLVNMEAFRGVFLAATNQLDRLDAASLRRFNHKIEFDWLADDGKLVFFERMFRDVSGTPLSDEDARHLTRIDCLAPGDFKVVRERFLFQRPGTVDNERLIAALEDEVRIKNRGQGKQRMGF